MAPGRPGPPACLRTGVGIGLAVGILVHPAMWYLALLVAFVSGTRTSLADLAHPKWKALPRWRVYAAVSLLLTGWLSCPISAAICGAGVALYARRPPA